MSRQTRISLDNPVFQGRLRQPVPPRRMISTTAARSPAQYFDRAVSSDRQLIAEISDPQSAAPSRSPSRSSPVEQPALPIIKAQPFASPAQPRQQRSQVLKRQLDTDSPVNMNSGKATSRQGYSRLQLSLIAMAGFIFICGLTVYWQTLRTNHAATAQVAALSKQSARQNDGAPSTIKPSSSAFNNYAVAPDLPRYVRIPRLGVNARVLQTGVTSSGALGTPNNVFDTAWYTGSAKPGQPGATLIDGHVSSWSTHGVFYGLKKLTAGDSLQIVRGDGAVINYQVVRTQTYDVNHVDMQAAVTPVVAGTPGLNLITCTGQVKSGTSDFNQRLIVFTKQI